MLRIRIRLFDAPELDSVPELDDPGTVFSVASPASYVSWSAMFAAADAASADSIILGAGNYNAAWGTLTTSVAAGVADGTSGRRRVLKYVGNENPWLRDENDRAIVGQLSWWDNNYWVISGLTFEHSVVAWRPSTNIVIHENHWYGAGGYCVRLFGSNNTCQRNYFDTQASVGSDAPCIQIEPVQVGAGGNPTDNKVLDNEVRDWNDGIVFTADESEGIADNYIDGTVVRGNDVYLTSAKRFAEAGGTYSDAENAFDFKCGASDPASPVIVANNRCWGFRYVAPSLQQGGKSSNGALVTNHVYSQNVLFENNVMGDSPIGWVEHKWLGHLPYTPPSIADPRGTVLRNNVWYGIKDFAPDDTNHGVYRTTVGVTITGDRVLTSKRLGSEAVSLPQYGDTQLTGVTIDRVKEYGEYSDYFSNGDNNSEERIILEYQRKRLSGPEWAVIKPGVRRMRVGLR